MIGVGYSGCRNSRCMPRPTYCSFSIEPPQVEPEIATCTGSGQNSGCPEIMRLATPQQNGRVAVMHRLDVKHSVGRKIAQEDPAFDLRLDDAAVHFVRQIGVRVEHAYDRTLGYRVLPAGNKTLPYPVPSERSRPFRRTKLQAGCKDCVGTDAACPKRSRTVRPARRSQTLSGGEAERPGPVKAIIHSDRGGHGRRAALQRRVTVAK